MLVLGGIVGGYFILQNSTHYTVTLASVPGINYTYDSLSVKKGEDFIFDFELEENFVVYDDLFSITVNGQKIEKQTTNMKLKM